MARRTKPGARAWLRIAAVTLLALPLIPLQSLAVGQGWRLAARLPVMFHRLVLRIIGVRIIEEGALDPRRPVLVAANHVSWLDIPVIGSLAPLSFVAKSEVAGWPVIGLFARLQRSVFIDRARRQQTGAATGAIGARLRAADPMVLFAEGTTGDGVRVKPFRTALVGAAREAAGAATWSWRRTSSPSWRAGRSTSRSYGASRSPSMPRSTGRR